MKDENEPDVSVLLETFQATRVDLVHERQSLTRIFDEATLSRRAELLAVHRLQVPDRPNHESSLKLVHDLRGSGNLLHLRHFLALLERDLDAVREL